MIIIDNTYIWQKKNYPEKIFESKLINYDWEKFNFVLNIFDHLFKI